ncbi:MAG TPA: FG-GAP-like repeat-containing protein [Pyrinomonadaceae bacterium]|nr:FG-GAP-like repeat-containing protein [Pyrinomonadaceae bacterium]
MPRSLPRARRGLPRAALLLGLLAALTAAFQLTERTTSAADFCAAPTFGPATTYPVGRARGMAIGDFNGDGLNDLAVTDNFVAGKVSVLLGKPGGTFGPAAHFTTGRNPWSVAVGDFNGDSKSDLATANFNDFEGDATTLAGNGAGGFGPAVNHFLTSPGSSANSPAVAAADFNLDGKTDLAVANMTHHAVVFMFGLGDGTFGSVKFVGVGGFLSPIHVVVADFNKDGKPDVATANNTAQNVSVLLGDGAGNFVAPALFNVGNAPTSLAAADFNGDNNPDLAVANQGSNTVSVLRGDGAGGFSTGGQFATGGTNPTSVASADFNGDGHTDLAVTNFMENNVVVLRGDGAGSFTPTASFDTGGRETQFVVAADFNGDGEPDLAAANELSRNVSVLLNTCGSAAATSTVQFEAATYFAFENQDPLRFQVAVTRTGDITAAATVEYSTSALTATPGADYTETSGTFNFAPGETRKVFNVPVSDDNLDEADETVRLQLTNASGATLGTSSATATVLDNDAAPSVSVGDVSVNEGDAGTTAAVYTVSLSAPSGKTVTVGINNADGTAVGGGNDYFHYPGPYTLTFTPG